MPPTHPTPAELALLKQLWARGELTARELHESAGEQLGWTSSSTRRTLDRMIEKGLVTALERHGVKLHAAAAPKVATLADMARDFLVRVMEIETPAAMALNGGALLTDEEAAELKRLVFEVATRPAEDAK